MAANSTKIITDLGSVLSNGFASQSVTLANAAAGPIQDLQGNTKLAVIKAQELNVLIGLIQSAMDSSNDSTNYGLFTGIKQILV